MNMVVDAGNTFIKVGIFKNKSLEKKEVFDSQNALKHFMLQTPIENLMIGSVKWDVAEIASWSMATGLKLVFDSALSLPLWPISDANIRHRR